MTMRLSIVAVAVSVLVTGLVSGTAFAAAANTLSLGSSISVGKAGGVVQAVKDSNGNTCYLALDKFSSIQAISCVPSIK